MLRRLSGTSTMATSTLFLILVGSSLVLVHSASISDRDSYLPIEDHTENIGENLIDHDESGHIEGLLPPLETAKSLYDSDFMDSRYAIDPKEKVTRLQDESKTDEESYKFTEQEEDYLKQMSAAFAMMLAEATKAATDESSLSESENNSSWTNIKPVITISDKGLTVELGGNDQPIPGIRESSIPVANEEQTTEETHKGVFDDLVKAVWGLVRTSLDYASEMWGSVLFDDDETQKSNNSTTNLPQISTTSAPGASNPSGLIFAAEESRAIPNLPANEFDGRGRDIGSLLYGRGIA